MAENKNITEPPNYAIADALCDALGLPESEQTYKALKTYIEGLALERDIIVKFLSHLENLIDQVDAENLPLHEFLYDYADEWNDALRSVLSERAPEVDGYAGITFGEFINGQVIPDPNQLSLFESPDSKECALTIEKKYFPLQSTALINFLKQYLNNPTRLENSRKGRISVSEHYLTKDTIITYKGNDAELTLSVERVKELFAKRVQNGSKIFNFLLQKLNEQNRSESTEFLLKELIDAGIYANPDSAYRGLKTVLDKLMRIHVEGKIVTYNGKKKVESANTKASIISARTVTYKNCTVVLPPIIRNAAPQFTILPHWSYSLQSDNAYMLLDYIYYLARQNTKKIKERGYFTISLDAVRQHLGLPSPKEVKESHKGNYNKLITKPIDDAVTAIEDHQPTDELKITLIYDANYKNIHGYLEGYLQIELSGLAFEYMEQRAVKENKRRAETRSLKENKQTRKL